MRTLCLFNAKRDRLGVKPIADAVAVEVANVAAEKPGIVDVVPLSEPAVRGGTGHMLLMV